MTDFALTHSTFVVIACAALVTYGLRFGGLMIANRLPETGRVKRFMDALPGAILLSLVVPGMVAAGAVGCLAAGCTAVCAYKTRNAFLAMVIGVIIVAISRSC